MRGNGKHGNCAVSVEKNRCGNNSAPEGRHNIKTILLSTYEGGELPEVCVMTAGVAFHKTGGLLLRFDKCRMYILLYLYVKVNNFDILFSDFFPAWPMKVFTTSRSDSHNGTVQRCSAFEKQRDEDSPLMRSKGLGVLARTQRPGDTVRNLRVFRLRYRHALSHRCIARILQVKIIGSASREQIARSLRVVSPPDVPEQIVVDIEGQIRQPAEAVEPVFRYRQLEIALFSALQ